MQVVINGVNYLPATLATGRIGIAITTHNRPDILKQAIAHHKKYLPEDCVFLIVDDGSSPAAEIPEWAAVIRNRRPVGIARAKNACMEHLMDAGCDHIFLFDDDVWPIAKDWHLPYIASPEPHLMHLWGEPHFQTETLVAHPWPKGCVLYAERRVIERVGGMDPVFGMWGCEHMQWSDRIHNCGLTTARYQDIPNSELLIKALDRTGEVKTSVALEIRLAANTEAAAAGRYADHYIPLSGDAPAPENKVALSILIPSVHTRRSTFAPKIIEQVFGQYEALAPADQKRIEILMLTDTKHTVLGDKRNAMARIAKGDYVIYVDDDDRIADSYMRDLLAATANGHDTITFTASVSINGEPPKPCRYSIKHKQDENTATEYLRLPNHICAIKRDLVLRNPFPSKLKGEDSEFAALIKASLKTETHVDKVLYHYDYNEETTETQKKTEAHPAKPPVVDVVVLSKANSAALRRMTQNTIDSCIAGANPGEVSIVVIEQVPGVRYREAITITEVGDFAYNRFANNGAKTGSAPWIMIANSDLEFEKDWLKHLLAAKQKVVSPIDPGHSVQKRLTANEQGTVNGKHFSGWCFMLDRKLWEKIGGLDEDFAFWCADDSVIEQVKAAGHSPVVVVNARVNHLVSQTIGETTKADGRDDGSLTWGQVYAFEKKYGVKKFEGDSRYAEWKRKNRK